MNEAPITELFVCLSVDAKGEGICARIMPAGSILPLMTSKRRVADQMRALALKAAKEAIAMGHAVTKVQLVRFERSEVLWSSDVE